MVEIAPETAALTPYVEELYDACFAPGRGALSSYRLRDGVAAAEGLSLVALDDYGGETPAVVGAVRHWPIWIGGADAAWPALLLGPLAVHPTRQGEGVGGALIFDGLVRARALGWERVVLIGDAPFYARFGFAPIALDFPPPTNPARVLAKALKPGALDGVAGAVRPWSDPWTPRRAAEAR